jgi:hypothetical protein
MYIQAIAIVLQCLFWHAAFAEALSIDTGANVSHYDFDESSKFKIKWRRRPYEKFLLGTVAAALVGGRTCLRC